MCIRVCALIFATASIALTTPAEESDQYLVWGKNLPDSAPVLNAFINDRIAGTVALMNEQNPGCTCETLTVAIMTDIHQNYPSAAPLAPAELGESVMIFPPPVATPAEIYEASIYRYVAAGIIPSVARNIRIGSVHFGTDKFAEFFDMGRRYYVHFQEALASGLTPEQADDDTIRMGVVAEDSFWANATEGVFSLADLEAAYQGLLFAMDLCGGGDPSLLFSENRWMQLRAMDLGRYVSPYFDETFLPPLYSEGIQKAVYLIIERDYAPQATSELVADRFNLYRSIAPEPGRSLQIAIQYLRENEIVSQLPTLLTALGIRGTDPTSPWNPFTVRLPVPEVPAS